MKLWKYLKSKIYFAVFSFIVAFFTFVYMSNALARDNAYLACFIDDTSFMYKTNVLYTGSEIEANRISPCTGYNFLGVSDNNGFVNSRVRIRDFEYEGTTDLFSNSDGGYVSLSFPSSNGGKAVLKVAGAAANGITVSEFFSKLENINASEGHYIQPLTFPASSSGRNATSADINRAYSVQAAIADDFKNALLYINDGKSFTSVDSLVETAYYLVTAGDGSIIQNQFGTSYVIHFTDNGAEITDDDILYKIKISEASSPSDVYSNVERQSQMFCWKVKKGYVECYNGQTMEDGTVNYLNPTGLENDTEYITWEHLFVEAGILYAQGITYANQADIYAISELENSLVSTLRDLLNGMRSLLQLYSMEDCIFNNGIRGSSAFVLGVYPNSWTSNLATVYLIFALIALSMVGISLITLITKKQYSTISASARMSLIDGIKDLFVALMFIAFAWAICKLLFLVNYKFVNIWKYFVGSKTLAQIGGGYTTLAAIIYQFVYFVINIYTNVLYILRQLFVPVLIVISPLTIILYSFGQKGKAITSFWLKELLGNIFIQSCHAFAYGFILVCSNGLRGIESIVVCASIIPFSIFLKDLFGIGGDKILKQASSMANTGVNTIGTGITVASQALGNSLDGLGHALDTGYSSGLGHMAGGFLQSTGGFVKSVGGGANMGLGLGTQLALGEGGMGMMHTGSVQMSDGISGMSRGSTSYMRGLIAGGGPAGDSYSDYSANAASFGAGRNYAPRTSDNDILFQDGEINDQNEIQNYSVIRNKQGYFSQIQNGMTDKAGNMYRLHNNEIAVGVRGKQGIQNYHTSGYAAVNSDITNLGGSGRCYPRISNNGDKMSYSSRVVYSPKINDNADLFANVRDNGLDNVNQSLAAGTLKESKNGNLIYFSNDLNLTPVSDD